MKRIVLTSLCLILFVLVYKVGIAQINIVDAVAVDGNKNGFYGTLEIEFSVPVVDNSIKDPNDRDDWEFSLDPEFSSFITPSGFSTTVSYIVTSGITDHANDQYIQFSFNTEFTSNNGPVYFRYKQQGDKIWDSATGNTDSLPDFSLKSARDISPPYIHSITSDAASSGVLKVGDQIIFTLDLEGTDHDPNLIINPTQYNGEDLNWYTNNGGETYIGKYTVVDKGVDQDSPLQLIGVTATDQYSNVSIAVDGSDIAKTIDSNIPNINAVTSDATSVDTLIVDQEIKFTVDVDTTELGLTILPLQYNGQDLNWGPISGGDTYEGTYLVTEGDLDRTVPLQLTGVTAMDLAGNVSGSVNGSDVVVSIDANTPFINSVTSDATSTGALKVGDQINFTIDVLVPDGSLIVSPSTYNGENLNWFTNNGGDTYKGTYTVVEGNTDRITAYQLEGVKLTDPAGNESDLKDGTDIKKTIDANKPVITDFSVNPVTMIKGNTYTASITVNADSDTYSLVSGKLSGFTLTNISKDSDTQYSVDFTISDLGFDIDSEDSYELENLVLADGAGNFSSVFPKTITQSGDPILTKDPEAYLYGKYYTCDRDTTDMVVHLFGNAPWEIDINNGVSTTTISNILSTPYIYRKEAIDNNGLIALDTAIYKVTRVEDNYGFFTNYTDPDSATVFIKNMPIVDITTPPGDQTYNINEEADTLVGNPLYGIFSGNGIVPSNNTFIPSSAGIGPHNIVYTYEDPATGCSNSDAVLLTVIETDAEVVFQDNRTWWCDYEPSFTVQGSVKDKPSISGTFSLDRDNAAISPAGTNKALIDIQQLSAGTYILSYYYEDAGVPVAVSKSFTIETVSSAIQIPVIGDHCIDYDTIFIEAENITPLNGVGNFTFSGDNNHYFQYGAEGNKLYFYPDSLQSGDYSLQYYYTTPNGCNSAVTTRNFKINKLPSVTITMDDLYNIESGIRTIQGFPTSPAGSFNPSYLINNGNGTAQFNPELAGVGIDTAYYIYTDANGCSNIDTAIFEVDEPKGHFVGIDKFNSKNQYCYFNSIEDIISVNVKNSDGTPGKFYIDGIEHTNIVGKDSMEFLPSNLGSGDFDLDFIYTRGGVEFKLDTVFQIDSIGNLSILSLESTYCEDDDRDITLTGVNIDGFGSGVNTFFGNGIIDEDGVFNPSDAGKGVHAITYTFTRDFSGCIKSTALNTTINNVPDVRFDLAKTCIAGPKDSVLITSITSPTDNIISWDWYVSALGNNRTSNDTNPKFSLTEQEKNFISLTVQSDKGCTGIKDSSIFIGSIVDVDFVWDNECSGDSVTFDVLEFTDPIGVDSIVWSFGGAGGANLSDIYKPKYYYSNTGGYDVTYIEYTHACGPISIQKRITMRPSEKLLTGEYIQDFEQGPDISGWAIDVLESTANNSWQWGQPIGTYINEAASGSNVFVTNLDGNYFNDELSMVTSPCFDLSGLERPMISFDFISALQTNRDGVILEYTVGSGNWKILGFADKGVNWYNTSTNYDGVLQSSRAWTGDGKNLGLNSIEWRTAKYWLEDVIGEAGVRFRFRLGTDDTGSNEGFAFDNIRIGERNRTVLVEHFANIAEDEFTVTQSNINGIMEENIKDAVLLQFFTSYPSGNLISDFYAAGPSARSLYYGISKVPYSILDGGDRRFSYSSTNVLGNSDVQKRMLESAQFEIRVEQNIVGNELITSSVIRAKENVPFLELNARVAIVEKGVEFTDNDNNTLYINNVLRAMLPDPAGKLLERDWLETDSVIIYETWQIPVGVNPDSIATIVFIQNEETNEIYQAGYTDELSTITSDKPNLADVNKEFSIYPNPFSSNFTIKLNKINTNKVDVNIYNNIGTVVKKDIVNIGAAEKVIDLSELPDGVYYIQLISDKIIKTQKIVKTK